MRIIAVFPQKEILDTITFAVESKLGAEVFSASSDKDGIQTLTEKVAVIDAVIIDGGEATLAAFSTYAKAQSLKTPFLVCFKGTPKDQVKIEGIEVLGLVDYGRLIEDVTTYLSGLKAKEKTEDKTEEEKKYCRISTNLLVKVSPFASGVHVRLSSTHFVKLFSSGDNFSAEDLKRYYQTKKIQFMYLLKEETGPFLQKLNQELENFINSSQVNVREANELVQESVDTVHELVNQIGVTPEVEKLVNNNVALSMKVMGDFPQLKDVLARMHLERDKYIPSHSILVAHLACSLAVAMDWYSDATFQKLTCAAFLHDVGILDHQLCAVKSLTDLEKNYQGKFSAKAIQDYRSHPKRGAFLVSQMKELGGEVDKIILQHHEHPVGSGFPDALKASHISPLTSVFIVAHDLVDYAFDHDGKIDIEDFIGGNETKLQAGNFKKVLKGLLSMAVK